ncbi:hypothetical protein TSUD_09520 [Trifolium subterraneum]|nr:hypothetical protein TSUD_09520 [Trifolium subterraneum]
MAKQGKNLQKNNVFPIPNWSFSSLNDPKLAIPVSLLRITVSIELILFKVNIIAPQQEEAS